MTGVDEVHITLLGAPHWSANGLSQPLARRDAALLALLAVEGPMARDRVAGWLWPEADGDAKARLSLRQRIFRLRRSCGHALIDAGQTLSLLPGVRVDLHRQPLPTAGALLAGLDFSAFEAFDTWLGAARQAVGARQADALAGQAAALEARGALSEAILLVEHIVATWPTAEHAWRRLMRLHWRRADRASAVATFERFEQAVCREWGLRPAGETLALLAEIEQGGSGPTRSAPTLLPASLLNPPRLVGRQQAMDALTQAWADGRAAWLLGPGGMGKTRLLEAFIAGRPGTLHARAQPGDEAVPYATLSRALDLALTRLAPTLAEADQAELARLLPRLGPAPAAPAQPPALARAVAAAWQAAMAAGLTAIAWDDLHWADAATLDLLHAELADPALGPLRRLFAARTDEAGPSAQALPRWLGDSLRVQPVPLTPWTLHDLHELLPTLDLPAPLATDPDLPARLMQQTGGQPFFVLETLKTLVLAQASGAAPATPPAVSAMIDRRVARLGDPPRRLLQLLAVSGAPLALPLLGSLLARPPLLLADDWSALAAAQLVRDDGLAHDLVRQAVLASLPGPALQALHLALAQALQGQPGTPPAQLAHHWAEAGLPAEAAAAWLQAAAQAVRTGRLAEADSLYGRAEEAAARAGDPGRQVAVLAAAQPTWMLLHGPGHVADRVQALLPDVQATPTRARLRLLQAEAEMSRMDAAAALAATAEALALADEAGDDPAAQDPLLLADATLLHGRALAWTGQAAAGVRLLEAACERATTDGDLRRRLQAHGTLADVLVAAGRRVQAVQVQRETVALAQRLGDRLELAVGASNLALHALLVGDAGTSLAAGAQAMGAFAEMGVAHVNRVMCASVHAWAAAHHGRFDRALALAEPLLGGPDDPVRRNLHNTLSTLALWRGRPDQAQALLPPLQADDPLSVRVTSLFARLRWLAWTGGDAHAEQAALAALGDAHPGLRDDAHYYRAWAPFDPPAQALARLDALAAQEAQAGADGNARSLALVAVQVVWPVDPDEAARRAHALWPAWAQGLHPALLPSDAHWHMAAALQAGGHHAWAGAALARGRAWLAAVQLPDDTPEARKALHEAVPAHARLLSGLD